MPELAVRLDAEHGVRAAWPGPTANAAGDRMVADVDRPVGRWRIATGAWPQEHLYLCGPAFLPIDATGRDDMAFGAVGASVEADFTPDDIDLEWSGADEAARSGDGWADLREDGCLEGEIIYHDSDETSFIAKPWTHFPAAC